jgi:hypothetical protein
MAILSRQIGWSQESNLIYELLRELNRMNQILGSSPLTTAQLAALPVYADNAAALAGGLTAGQLYRTSTGVLMVTY